MSDPVTQACVRCRRTFQTSEVKLLRFNFPADRICASCRQIESAEADERVARHLLEQAHIPLSYRERQFSDFEPGPGTGTALKLATAWSRDFRHGIRQRGLLFSGPPGVGKTHLAVAILREAAYMKVPSLFVNVPEWLSSLRESWDGGPPVLSPREYKLLAIDDLGAEQSTDWSREQIYGLINHRSANRLSTLVTTNLTTSELTSRLGRATTSRLLSACRPVEIDGADRRLLDAQAV